MPDTFVDRHVAYYQAVIEAWKKHKKLTDEELEFAVLSAEKE